MNQRLRSDNFSTKETEVLLRLVRLNEDVIELKKSDRASCELRSQKWEEICHLFNNHFGTARTVKSLKHKYDNHKRNRPEKKKNVHYHSAPLVPIAPKVPLVPYNVSVVRSDQGFRNILGNALDGRLVDNPDFSTKNSLSTPGENMPVQEITYVENIKEEMVEEDTDSWSNVAPSESRPTNPHHPRSSEDGMPKRGARFTQLMQEKLDYVKLQKQLLLEEHQLKLKQMEELHEKQMVELDLSIELKRKQLSN